MCPTPIGEPRTRAGLAADLRRLGVRPGDTLLVHASMRSVGWVVGGAVTVVHALHDAVGPDGTLVVPTATPGNADPSRWNRDPGPVPEPWWPAIREALPAFDAAVTPSSGMGAVAETVRTWPGAVRSGHPQVSFAAVGPAAPALMAGHDRDCRMGDRSPLGRLFEHAARVLLLGVPYTACAAFHLIEYQLPAPPLRDYECVVADEGHRHWYRYRDVDLDNADFDVLGRAFEASKPGLVFSGTVGAAPCRLLPVREAVIFGVPWLTSYRAQQREAEQRNRWREARRRVADAIAADADLN